VLAQLVARNTAWLMMGRVAIQGLSGVIAILLARYLGAEEFGRYTLLYAYLALFMWMVTFGVENILIREAARRRSSADELFSVGCTFASVSALVALALALAGTFGLSYAPGVRWLILVAAGEVLLLQPFYLLRFVFRVELKQWVPVLAEIVVSVLRLGLVSALIVWRATLPWFVVGKLLCSVAFAVALVVLSRRYVRIRWQPQFRTAGALLKEAWPLGLTALGGMVICRLDQLMIHSYLSATALGLYATAWTLIQFSGIFPNSLMASFFPVMSRRRDDPQELERLARLAFKYCLMTIWPVAMITTLWADEIIAAVYGAKYAGAGTALALMIWGMPSAFFGVVLRDTFIVAARQRYLLWMNGAELVVCVILNFLLIPRWGIAGAALASVGHNVLANVLVPALFAQTRRFVWLGLREAVIPALGCLGLGVAGIMWHSPAVGALAGVTAYGALLIGLRGISREDVQYLRAVTGLRLPGCLAKFSRLGPNA
jgi:O-antigen/teichoic acid export membrane protein